MLELPNRKGIKAYFPSSHPLEATKNLYVRARTTCVHLIVIRLYPRYRSASGFSINQRYFLYWLTQRIFFGRDELAAALAAIEAERRGRSGSIQKPPRSLQAEMECEVSGSSLGESEDPRAEMARACKRLRELCNHLRRGEDDSGLQSDCDESMLVIVNDAESEVKHLIFNY